MEAITENMRGRELNGDVAIGVAAAALAVFFMGSTLLTPLYGLYEKAFGFSRVSLTLIYAIYVVGNLGALLFFGRLSDEVGRRRATLLAVLVASVSTLVFLFAVGTAWLFWARMLSGFAIGIGSGTTTAWLAELHDGVSKSRATLMASGANMAGLAIGPLLAGFLVQYMPWPLHLPHIFYLLTLIAIGLLILRMPETVEEPITNLSEISLRPRLGVPKAIRARFVAPAVAVFVSMALVGFLCFPPAEHPHREPPPNQSCHRRCRGIRTIFGRGSRDLCHAEIDLPHRHVDRDGAAVSESRTAGYRADTWLDADPIDRHDLRRYFHGAGLSRQPPGGQSDSPRRPAGGGRLELPRGRFQRQCAAGDRGWRYHQYFDSDSRQCRLRRRHRRLRAHSVRDRREVHPKILIAYPKPGRKALRS